jgi:hypothetical protein
MSKQRRTSIQQTFPQPQAELKTPDVVKVSRPRPLPPPLFRKAATTAAAAATTTTTTTTTAVPATVATPTVATPTVAIPAPTAATTAAATAAIQAAEAAAQAVFQRAPKRKQSDLDAVNIGAMSSRLEMLSQQQHTLLVEQYRLHNEQLGLIVELLNVVNPKRT